MVHALYKVSVQDLAKCSASRDVSCAILCLDCYPFCLNLLETMCSDTAA